jgi:hypothetical protein
MERPLERKWPCHLPGWDTRQDEVTCPARRHLVSDNLQQAPVVLIATGQNDCGKRKKKKTTTTTMKKRREEPCKKCARSGWKMALIESWLGGRLGFKGENARSGDISQMGILTNPIREGLTAGGVGVPLVILFGDSLQRPPPPSVDGNVTFSIALLLASQAEVAPTRHPTASSARARYIPDQTRHQVHRAGRPGFAHLSLH